MKGIPCKYDHTFDHDAPSSQAKQRQSKTPKQPLPQTWPQWKKNNRSGNDRGCYAQPFHPLNCTFPAELLWEQLPKGHLPSGPHPRPRNPQSKLLRASQYHYARHSL